jgi:hypothetical protein
MAIDRDGNVDISEMRGKSRRIDMVRERARMSTIREIAYGPVVHLHCRIFIK